MLESNIQSQLKAYLERLQQPVELIASLDDRPASTEMRELLTDIAGLSDKVTVRFDEDRFAGSGLLVFAGVCGEAMYVLLARRIANRVPVVTQSFFMQLFSLLLLLPLCLPVLGSVAALAAPQVAALVAFHSLTSSVLCLLLWYAGLRRVPAGIAGVFSAFLPASAAAVAILFLGETPGPVHAGGFVLLMASLLLATWPTRMRR